MQLNNDRSDFFNIFSAFESPMKVFDSIFGDKFIVMNNLLLKFPFFAPEPKMYEKGDQRTNCPVSLTWVLRIC